jgi:tRNA pseudouridine38-40 synthase
VRLRIDLSYDGRDFHGWAAQPGLRTVEGDLATGLATVLGRPSVSLVCAGRTDTGVHARGQVVHVDVDKAVLAAACGRGAEPPIETLARRLNRLLPPDLRVRRVVAAADGFDARFSPLWRSYAYRVCDGVPDPVMRGHVLSWPRPLDGDAMNQASAGLVGRHDFAAFCKRREGATTVRTLMDLSWERDGDLLTGRVRADAFCHRMVRSLVGCLLAVGEGRRPVVWPAEVLATRSRDAGLLVVPAHGLVLEEVGYPPDAELGARAGLTRARREQETRPEDRL